MTTENQTMDVSAQQGARWATVAVVLFICMFASFGLQGKWEGAIFIITYAAVSSHLALLPVINSLPAPTWAKVGGYTWAMFDTILSVATLNGIPLETVTPYRLGLHTAAAVWPLGAAIYNKGAIRWAGIAFTLAFAIIPLIGPLVPPKSMYIAMPFTFIWLGAIIWTLRKNKI